MIIEVKTQTGPLWKTLDEPSIGYCLEPKNTWQNKINTWNQKTNWVDSRARESQNQRGN